MAVIILNWNGRRWLQKCLSSVVKTEYPNVEIYLLDNGSVDDSVAYVTAAFTSVKVIMNSRNLGFSAAYNKAIERVDAEYIVLLNNDTEILNSEWLNALVGLAERRPDVAAVTCKMVTMDDHRILDSVGGTGIPFWRGFVDIGKGELDAGQYSHNFEPFSFCGGAALVRKSSFTLTGAFDERLFLYTEDSDLSWRFRLLGFRIAHAPPAKVAHFFSGTSGGGNLTPFKLYYCHRNLLRCILKNCGSSLKWALRNYLIYTSLMLIGYTFTEQGKLLAVLRGLIWNMWHLEDTLSQRKQIQARREIADEECVRRMFPALPRYQPDDHVGIRRVLNVLFDFSNRKNCAA